MRSLLVASALTAGALVLGGCSGGSHGPGDAGSADVSSSSGTTIRITVKDGKVTPNGRRVKASVDQPVTLVIDADTAGEIHVHSTPEQEIEFDRGTSSRKLTITRPGIVDVEDHAADQVIVQLQVS